LVDQRYRTRQSTNPPLGTNMPDKHLSTQFDSELTAVSAEVMELGGLVEAQILHAIMALSAV
jgi:hypothetical protein